MDTRHFNELPPEERKEVIKFLDGRIELQKNTARELLATHQKYIVAANTGGIGVVIALLARYRPGWLFLILAGTAFVAGLIVTLVMSYRLPARLAESIPTLTDIKTDFVTNQIPINAMNERLRGVAPSLGRVVPNWAVSLPLFLFVVGCIGAMVGLVTGSAPLAGAPDLPVEFTD